MAEQQLGHTLAVTSAAPQTNEDIIYNFFKSKGLNNIDIAGIMGNEEVESGFRTTAYNPNESAIGISQWEGGRRTALQNFAKSMGTTETDLNAQLAFTWHELTGAYAGALTELQGDQSVAAAATTIDSRYEVSAGTTRQQRIQDAQQVYTQISNGGMPTGGPTSSGSGSSNGGANTLASGASSGNPVTDVFGVLLDPLKIFGAGGLGGITDIPGAITSVAAPLQFIGKFFKDLVWIFNPTNFIRTLLYVFGVMIIIAGLGMVVFGTGKDRPA